MSATKMLDKALSFSLEQVRIHGSPDRLSSAVRIVVLVHAAQGVIDNGGLQYFFEGDFPGNPPYSQFIDAYREIGATAEAAVLADAVALFPFENPHLYESRRNEVLDSYKDEEGDTLPESPFEQLTRKLCGNKHVWQQLEKFVELHLAEFPV